MPSLGRYRHGRCCERRAALVPALIAAAGVAVASKAFCPTPLASEPPFPLRRGIVFSGFAAVFAGAGNAAFAEEAGVAAAGNAAVAGVPPTPAVPERTPLEQFVKETTEEPFLTEDFIGKGRIDADRLAVTMSDSDYNKAVKDLTPYQRHIAIDMSVQEKPFSDQKFANGYKWDTQQPGVYASAVSGTILYSSGTKFDSGFGWPSFTDPVDKSRIVQRYDRVDVQNFPEAREQWRIEVLDKKSMTHLGYVYPGGPGQSKLRYILNAAVLKFVPGDPKSWDPLAQV